MENRTGYVRSPVPLVDKVWSRICMMGQTAPYLLLVVISMASTLTAIAAQGADQPITPQEQGVWQSFRLPNTWLRDHGSGEPLEAAYVTLQGPGAAAIIADSAPCWSPSRITLLVVDSDGRSVERLIDCVDFCGQPQSAEGWGSLTYVRGLAVAVSDEGALKIRKLLSKRAFVPPDTPIREPPALEGADSSVEQQFFLSDLLAHPAITGTCGCESN